MNSPLTKTEQLKQEVLISRAAKLLALRTRGDREGAIAAVARDAALPLSWGQQRLWLLEQIDMAAGAAYRASSAMRLRGRLDVDALRAALDGLVARHEILRT
ncbi:condensation domain-containing protein, partial [Duganella sp. CT11-25]